MENKLWSLTTLAYRQTSFQMHPMLQSSRINSLWTEDACLTWKMMSDSPSSSPSNLPCAQPPPLKEIYPSSTRPTRVLEIVPAHAVAQQLPPKEGPPQPLTKGCPQMWTQHTWMALDLSSAQGGSG